MKVLRIFLGLTLVSMSGCVSVEPPRDVLATMSDQDALKFVETVLVGTEYEGGRLCSRWVRKPTISVFNGTSQDEAAVAEVVSDLNEILSPTRVSLKQLAPHRNADIEVIFAPKNNFAAIARSEDFHYVPGHPGFFSIWWNANHEIYRAIVLIATELQGARRNHFIREEITQALGFANDSPQIKSSIFYEKGSDGGRATAYNDLDRKMIRFFYQYVLPGDTREDLQRAFNLYWSTM